MTRAEILELMEEMQDRGGPDFEELVRQLEAKNRFLYMLKMHAEIECESERRIRDWKRCQ